MSDLQISKVGVTGSGVTVGHGWATAQGARYKGAPAPYLCSLIKRNLYLLVNSLKAKKIVMVTTLILFLLINCYFIISFAFFIWVSNAVRGALEILPRALVGLRPALGVTSEDIVICRI